MPQVNSQYLAKTLKFQQLHLIVELSKNDNLARAAEKLNITQSAATKILKKLESILDVELFERHARGMRPTEIGYKFIKHAKIILAQLRYSADEIEELKSGTLGHVNVGTLIAATSFLLPETIARITSDYPNIKISIKEGTNNKLIPDLAVGELDIIVGRLTSIDIKSGLKQQYLYDDPIRLVCSHSHPIAKLKKHSLTLKDLIDFNWILPLQGTDLRAEICQSFTRLKLPMPKHSIESVSVMTNIRLLEKSDFIAVLPTEFISDLVELGLIYILPVKLESTLDPVGYKIRDIKKQSPALSIFVKYLHETALVYSDKN